LGEEEERRNDDPSEKSFAFDIQSVFEKISHFIVVAIAKASLCATLTYSSSVCDRRAVT
jgi:hypothetical protein